MAKYMVDVSNGRKKLITPKNAAAAKELYLLDPSRFNLVVDESPIEKMDKADLGPQEYNTLEDRTAGMVGLGVQGPSAATESILFPEMVKNRLENKGDLSVVQGLSSDVLSLPGRTTSGIGAGIGAAANQIIPAVGQALPSWAPGKKALTSIEAAPGGFRENVGREIAEGMGTTYKEDPATVGKIIKDPVTGALLMATPAFGAAAAFGGKLGQGVASVAGKSVLGTLGAGAAAAGIGEAVTAGTREATGQVQTPESVANDIIMNLAFGIGGETLGRLGHAGIIKYIMWRYPGLDESGAQIVLSKILGPISAWTKARAKGIVTKANAEVASYPQRVEELKEANPKDAAPFTGAYARLSELAPSRTSWPAGTDLVPTATVSAQDVVDVKPLVIRPELGWPTKGELSEVPMFPSAREGMNRSVGGGKGPFPGREGEASAAGESQRVWLANQADVSLQINNRAPLTISEAPPGGYPVVTKYAYPQHGTMANFVHERAKPPYMERFRVYEPAPSDAAEFVMPTPHTETPESFEEAMFPQIAAKRLEDAKRAISPAEWDEINATDAKVQAALANPPKVHVDNKQWAESGFEPATEGLRIPKFRVRALLRGKPELVGADGRPSSAKEMFGNTAEMNGMTPGTSEYDAFVSNAIRISKENVKQAGKNYSPKDLKFGGQSFLTDVEHAMREAAREAHVPGTAATPAVPSKKPIDWRSSKREDFLPKEPDATAEKLEKALFGPIVLTQPLEEFERGSLNMQDKIGRAVDEGPMFTAKGSPRAERMKEEIRSTDSEIKGMDADMEEHLVDAIALAPDELMQAGDDAAVQYLRGELDRYPGRKPDDETIGAYLAEHKKSLTTDEAPTRNRNWDEFSEEQKRLEEALGAIPEDTKLSKQEKLFPNLHKPRVSNAERDYWKRHEGPPVDNTPTEDLPWSAPYTPIEYLHRSISSLDKPDWRPGLIDFVHDANARRISGTLLDAPYDNLITQARTISEDLKRLEGGGRITSKQYANFLNAARKEGYNEISDFMLNDLRKQLLNRAAKAKTPGGKSIGDILTVSPEEASVAGIVSRSIPGATLEHLPAWLARQVSSSPEWAAKQAIRATKAGPYIQTLTGAEQPQEEPQFEEPLFRGYPYKR